MKISNEIKVGILAVVSIIILILGFTFLKGSQLFSKPPVLYAVFKNLGALEKSNLVKINGLPIGKVYEYKPINKEVDSILVEIHLNEEINIPSNSTAFINSAFASLGSSYITIEKGTAKTYLETGDTISTLLKPDMLSDLRTQLSPTINRVNETVDSLKFVLGKVNAIFDPNTNNNLQSLIANLTLSSAHLQRLLNAESGQLAQAIGNMNSVTGNLARSNDQITASIRNVEVTTANLANARIPQIVTAMEGTINELKGTVSNLNSTVGRINSKDGTLGLLLNDRQLYDQFNKVALGFEILADDIRINPKRYVNISILGNKSKPGAITSPAIKDTVAVKY